MGNTRHLLITLLFFILIVSTIEAVLLPHIVQGDSQGMGNPRRVMIGSTAPTCTYNECRGCKYRCRAEQVPVEGNDPINSAYHYRCVCHR